MPSSETEIPTALSSKPREMPTFPVSSCWNAASVFISLPPKSSPLNGIGKVLGYPWRTGTRVPSKLCAIAPY